MLTIRRLLSILALLATAGLATGIAYAAQSGALTTGTTTVTPAGHPEVYQDVYQGFARDKNIPLGLQSTPTQVLTTPALPAGTYLIHYSIGVVIGPSDNIVCEAAPLSGGPGNDGIFGGAGNGASESGTGPAGIYANAASVDVWKTTKPGDQIAVWCNHTNANGGSYAGGGSIIATPVGTWTKDTQ